ncbi:MAG: sigma-70 family RNA polymerase sigma factor [Rhodobacteraceae bacterium]|nr:sigma-70 family RNA polymerase sigma factor [Paracoccaceae bacterium]
MEKQANKGRGRGPFCFTEERKAILPLDAAIQENLGQIITQALGHLSPREERVLRLRFGIGMHTDQTLFEVGEQFNLTRERIRQIELKALRKLRSSRLRRAMRSFLSP